MTWFLKMAGACATIILMGFTLGVPGYTLYMCQQDCKNETDDHLCGLFNYIGDDNARTNITRYQWLRNECERKCYSRGKYQRWDMEICIKNGQTRMRYICYRYRRDPNKHEKCMRNETVTKK